MRRWPLAALTLVAAALGLVLAVVVPARADTAAPPDGLGVVDMTQGIWYLRDPVTGATTSFYFGNPGDTPFMGDWNCDGIDTPGLYRRSDGYVYLRNTNTQGVADVSFYFGDPGDLPLAGDFDGDGCDTVSLFRPSLGRLYVIDRLGSEDAGLGKAELEFPLGNPGDVPFVGDFDGDGVDTFGMHRGSTGTVYLFNRLGSAVADASFAYGNRNDRVVSGRWASDAVTDLIGLYRPSQGTYYLRVSGDATAGDDVSFQYGGRMYAPVSGKFGALAGDGAPPVNEPYLVSTFTTYHPAGQDRNINIDLIADMVDGAVVPPGATFSLNDHVGERTEEKGFVRAGAIINGEVYCCDHPANVGGGTSQFATTFYNAVFFGGYEDVYHRPHSLYFSRYPVAREATLGYPGPDVIFRNDTVFPLTIRTGHTPTAVTVEIWGDNEGRVVTTSTIGDVTPRLGGRATVYRTVVDGSGASWSQSWTHLYAQPVASD